MRPTGYSRSSTAFKMLGVLAGLLAAPGNAAPGNASLGNTTPAAPGNHAGAAARAPTSPGAGMRIVAVVNGEVITNADVENRARLFAISTGLPRSPEILVRLHRQIIRQLIDERLRTQEAKRRKIVIQDDQIAAAIRDIEQHNGMPSGALRQKLASDGISYRVLLDQIRAQLAWSRVLREQMADKLAVSDAEVEEQQRALSQQTGQREYRVGEIFIPVEAGDGSGDAQRFADIVIRELRGGAAFGLVAAQFSQTQTALEGGELGWVRASQLDPEIAKLVTTMPVGAVSNPIRVAGGITIVTLRAQRELGRDLANAATVRQVFLPFPTPLDPQAPTPQQRQILEKARQISASVNSCERMEQVAAENRSSRPVDPGEIRIEGVEPATFRQTLLTLPIGKATQPLIARDGIAVLVICSREQKNMATISRDDVRRQLVNDRVELLSRQTQRELRRQASIDLRESGV